MRFTPEATYHPGKGMLVADALSRSPLQRSDRSDMEEDLSLHVSAATSSWPPSDERLELIRQRTKEDVNLALSLQYTVNDWPIQKEDV